MNASSALRVILGFSLVVSLGACVTSSDFAESHRGGGSKDNYVDPTNVKTVDVNPPASKPQLSGGTDVEGMARENDSLKGELEDTQHQLQETQRENKRLADELAKAKVPPPAAPLATAASVPEALTPPPQKTGAPLLWESAMSSLQENHYKDAITSLDELLKNYPKDHRAYFAALAVSMAQYRLENYKESALNFNQLIDKYPKRSETSIAWFGQGAAFYKMGQKDDAKLFYGEVIKRYPKTEAAKLAKKYNAKKSGGAPRDLFTSFPDWDEKLSK